MSMREKQKRKIYDEFLQEINILLIHEGNQVTVLNSTVKPLPPQQKDVSSNFGHGRSAVREYMELLPLSWDYVIPF